MHRVPLRFCCPASHFYLRQTYLRRGKVVAVLSLEKDSGRTPVQKRVYISSGDGGPSAFRSKNLRLALQRVVPFI